MRSLRALAIISFPTRPGALLPADERDLARALVDVGHAIAAGRNAHTGTIIVPYQRRCLMKVTFELNGPQGQMFDFAMKYHRLSPEYAMEIASTARAYANLVENTAGNAAGDDAKYSVEFRFQSDDAPPGEWAKMFKADARADNLQYSQVAHPDGTGLQDRGLLLLQKLMQGAHMEVASGQRK